jgi:hypothetical protein
MHILPPIKQQSLDVDSMSYSKINFLDVKSFVLKLSNYLSLLEQCKAVANLCDHFGTVRHINQMITERANLLLM